MGKASRRKKVTDPAKLKAYRPPIPFVARPYEGLPKEIELVAMRELIPAATLTARTDADHGAVEFDFVTLLPEGHPAMVRPDGRILGKMGHSERRGYGLYQNVPGDRYQQLFEGGVGYFTD